MDSCVKLCKLTTPEGVADVLPQYVVEPKFDGFRFLYTPKNGFVSRTGKPLYHLSHLARLFNKQVCEGEIVGDNWNHVSSVARASKSFRAERLAAVVFELDVTSPDYCQLTYENRCALRDKFVSKLDSGFVTTPIGRTFTTVNAVKDYMCECVNAGCDGIILKKKHSMYIINRNSDWLKIKPVVTEEAMLIGLEEEVSIQGKPKGQCGSLLLRRPRQRVTFSCAGLTAEQKMLFWDTFDSYKGSLVEYKCRGFHSSGKPIEPRFVRVRVPE